MTTLAAATGSVNEPAIALLVATIAFLAGCGVGSTVRALRAPRPVGRRWVQPRSDITR